MREDWPTSQPAKKVRLERLLHEKIYFNAKAERITQPRKEKSVIQFIFDLHANLLLGNLGKILLFLIGVFLIISLFTGQKLSQKYLKVKNIKNSLLIKGF